MQKQQRRFEVTVPFGGMSHAYGQCRAVHHCDVTVQGVAYDYGACDADECRYDYDVNALLYRGTDIADLIAAQYGGVKEWDAIHEAVAAHLPVVFRKEEQVRSNHFANHETHQ